MQCVSTIVQLSLKEVQIEKPPKINADIQSWTIFIFLSPAIENNTPVISQSMQPLFFSVFFFDVLWVIQISLKQNISLKNA